MIQKKPAMNLMIQTTQHLDDQINEQWQQWLSALERVLIQLDSEGVFANGIDRNKITIAILAYDETEAAQFERIKRINPPIVLENIKIDFDTMIANRNEIEQSVLAKFEGVS